jgi:predicted lysophospholipase L1 biosynthesis ABC-type transport system permease subunit
MIFGIKALIWYLMLVGIGLVLIIWNVCILRETEWKGFAIIGFAFALGGVGACGVIVFPLQFWVIKTCPSNLKMSLIIWIWFLLVSIVSTLIGLRQVKRWFGTINLIKLRKIRREDIAAEEG